LLEPRLPGNSEIIFSRRSHPVVYRIRVESSGFRTASASIELLVGREATLNLSLEIEAGRQVVSVDAQAAQVNTTEYKVEGVVSRQQIESMPLNGRNALELARLQPGVLVGSGVPSGKNGFVSVSIGGETAAATRVTVDGGSVNDSVTGGTGRTSRRRSFRSSRYPPATSILPPASRPLAP
jgi:hypothetical protein